MQDVLQYRTGGFTKVENGTSRLLSVDALRSRELLIIVVRRDDVGAQRGWRIKQALIDKGGAKYRVGF